MDPEYDTPTFDCLATTGSQNLSDYVGQRLPPRTASQTGHQEIVVTQIDQSNEFRGALPKSTEAPRTTIVDTVFEPDFHISICYGVFHMHPNITHGAARDDFQNGIMPLVTTYRQHLQ